MARSREPWFDYILRNKAIRTFLANYAEEDWQEVTKLTLLYGILNLNFFDGKPIVPLEKLRDIVAKGARAAEIESAIPGLNNKLEDLRMLLDDVGQDIHGEPARGRTLNRHSKETVEAVPPAPLSQNSDEQRADLAAANVALRHAEKWLRYKGRGLAVDPQDMPAKLLGRAAAAAVATRGVSPNGLPPSEWRTGERARTYSPPGKKRSPVQPGDGLQGPEYPSWWGDGEDWRSSSGGGGGPLSPRDGGGRSRSAPRPGRRPPRLAYSVQAEPESPAQPIWRNDLVTSRYLDVPSSGYGRPASPPPLPQQYMPQQPQQHGYGAPDLPPPGVSGPFQTPYGAPDPYGNGGGGVGPQLYVVQPTGAVAPANAAAVTAAWGQPPLLQQQYHAAQMPQRQQRQQQQQRGNEASRPAWKPIRTSKEATSRIREQVQADRAAARTRREARQRAVEASLAPPRPRIQRPQEGAWSAAGAGASPRSPTGPSDIADSLAANPFTAWFIAPPQQQQQQAQQQGEQQQQQQTQQQELPRPPTPAVQQQQHGWAETLRAAPPAAVESGGGAAAPPAFPSWPGTPQPAALPQQPAAPIATAGTGSAGASLTFCPQVPSAGGGYGYPAGGQGQGQGQSRGGFGPPGVAPSSPTSSYSPYGDAGLYQTRRVAWPDGHQAASQQQQQGPPSWLSGPAIVDGAWQQQQQRPPPEQWLAGQQSFWPGAPVASNSSAAAAAAPCRGWADQAGWVGPGVGAMAAPRPQLSPRAEALRAVRPEVVQWSKSWVGDFGHLDEARFPPRQAQNDGAQQQAPGQQRQGVPQALATADALLAAAAASREGKAEAGLYSGADGAAEAGVRQQSDAPAAERPREYRQEAASAAAQAAAAADREAAEGGAGPSGREGWIRGQGGSEAGAGAGGGREPGAAAGVAVLERAWGGRFGRAPEVETGNAWAFSEAATGAGGVKWDFDKIIGSPSGLTY